MTKLITEKKLSMDSVDTQIDTFIVEFEDKALKNKPVDDAADAEGAPPEAELPPEPEEENEAFLGRVGSILKENIAFLLEADDEEEESIFDDKEKEEKGEEESIFDEEPAEEKGGSKTQFKINVNSPPEPNRVPENLDVDTFAANLARLINHADTLLSVKKVIYTRAMNFLEENYDEDTRKMAEMSVKTNFDVDVQPDEKFNDYESVATEREY